MAGPHSGGTRITGARELSFFPGLSCYLSLFAFVPRLGHFKRAAIASAAILTFSELRALARPEGAPEPVMQKLQGLLNTPFIENRAARRHRGRPQRPGSASLLEYRTRS